MKISIVCTDPAHPVNAWLDRWVEQHLPVAEVEIVRDRAAIGSGDLLFLISCHDIIGRDIRDRYRHSFVIHASDLPAGRGWSPAIWAVIGGADEIVVTLLEAEDAVDSGRIWAQRRFALDGTELANEINAKLFDAEIELMDWAVENCDRVEPRPQSGEPSYHRKRTPADSEVDPQRPLAEAFDLLRVADPDRYPAFFTLRGQRYRIRIEKM